MTVILNRLRAVARLPSGKVDAFPGREGLQGSGLCRRTGGQRLACAVKPDVEGHAAARNVRKLPYDHRTIAVHSAIGQTGNKIGLSAIHLRAIENVDVDSVREFVGQRIVRKGCAV